MVAEPQPKEHELNSIAKTELKAAMCAGASALVSFGLTISSALAETYTTFDVPNSNLTEPAGINDNGDATGLFMPSAGGFFTGFIRSSDGTFTTFAVKNSLGTTPSAINGKGEIVGDWDSEYGFNGFLRKSDGTILDIDPRHLSGGVRPSNINALRINDAGAIAGGFTDNDGMEKGFLRKANGKTVTYGVTGSPVTQPYGLNSTGAVTGYYWNIDDNTYVGFVRAPDGTIATFGIPDASRTVPIAISDSGTVTGYYDHPTSSGFVRSPDGTVVSFDPPGSQQTNPIAINRKGEIAGHWFDGTHFHGFIRSANGKITSFDPPDSKSTTVTGMNRNGVVIGIYGGTDGRGHGFIRMP